MRIAALFLVAVALVLDAVAATSFAEPPRLKRVARAHVATSVQNDAYVVDVSLDSMHFYSNLHRRWYARADPNEASHLSDLKFATKQSRDSRDLYSFFTSNDTLEVPTADLNFRLVLSPQEQNTPLHINGEPVDNDFVVLDGSAFRKAVTTSMLGDMSSFKSVGWARLTFSNQSQSLQGSFEVSDERGMGVPQAVFHLSTVEVLKAQFHGLEGEIEGLEGLQDDDMVVYRDMDTLEDNVFSHLDDYGETDWYSLFDDLEASESHFFKRSGADNDTGPGMSSGTNLAMTIGNTDGCSNYRTVALVGLVADCNYLALFRDQSTMRQAMLTMVTQASRFYELSFNITLGLKEIVSANGTSCPQEPTADQPWDYQCQPNRDTLADRLHALTKWRSNRKDDGIAIWTMMTSCKSDGLVGLAWLGMVCGKGEAAAGTNVITSTSLDTRVYAHECGHSFGAVHDCTDETCSQGLNRASECCPYSRSTCDAGGGYIMNPAATDSSLGFSPCSQGNVCGAIGSRNVNVDCLRSNTGGINLFTENLCGNGIVEEGEECDCGNEEECGPDSCCDPKTCKFRPGAECDDRNDECCRQCRFAGTNVLCRAATSDCDFPEYCPGNSSLCPPDQFKKDGEKCELPDYNGTSTLTCMSGHCSSRDLQCVTLMGNSTRTNGGTRITIVRACDDDSSCQLSCVDQTFGNSVCFRTNQNFMDGTPCRGSGVCRRGRCEGGRRGSGRYIDSGNSSGGSGYWRWIVIGVAGFIGAVLFVCFVLFCCRGNRSSRLSTTKRPTPVPPPPPPPNYGHPQQQYMRNPPPPPPAMYRNNPPSYGPSVAGPPPLGPPPNFSPREYGSGRAYY